MSINYRWRELLAAAMTSYFQLDESSLGLDNQDLLDDFLIDLYNAEVLDVRIINLAALTLPADIATTSTSYVVAATPELNHVFTKPNALITIRNILVDNTGSQYTNVKVYVAGNTPVEQQIAELFGATERTLTVASLYANITTGIARAIGLSWLVTGSTGVIRNSSVLGVQIEEWDS